MGTGAGSTCGDGGVAITWPWPKTRFNVLVNNYRSCWQHSYRHLGISAAEGLLPVAAADVPRRCDAKVALIPNRHSYAVFLSCWCRF